MQHSFSDLVQVSVLPLSIGTGARPSSGSSAKGTGADDEAYVFVRSSCRLPIHQDRKKNEARERFLEDGRGEFKRSKSKRKAAEQDERRRVLRENLLRDTEQRQLQELEETQEREAEERSPLVQLKDTLGFATGSYLGEMAYGMPLSQCLHPSSTVTMTKTGRGGGGGGGDGDEVGTVSVLSPYVAPFSELQRHGVFNREWVQSRPSIASPGPLGYTTQEDGTRQYVLFPVEEERYLLLVRLPHAVQRLMGSSSLPVSWLCSMAVRGYPIQVGAWSREGGGLMPSTLPQTNLLNTNTTSTTTATTTTGDEEPEAWNGAREPAAPLYLPLDARLKMDDAERDNTPPPDAHTLPRGRGGSMRVPSVKAVIEEHLRWLPPLFDQRVLSVPSVADASAAALDSARWWREKRRRVHQLCTERHSSMRYPEAFALRLRKDIQDALRGGGAAALRNVNHGGKLLDQQERRFHVTGFALWFQGEPIVAAASHHDMEDVHLPAALTATLSFGTDHERFRYPYAAPNPYLASSAAYYRLGDNRPNDTTSSANNNINDTNAGTKSKTTTMTSPHLQEEKPKTLLQLVTEASAGGVSSGGGTNALAQRTRQKPMVLSTQDELDQEFMQVRCTSMYAKRLASLMASGNGTHGVQLPSVRPEDAALNAAGQLAMSFHTGRGWLLTVQLEPSAVPMVGSCVSDVLSGAQHLLGTTLSAPHFLREMASQATICHLRRPISIYSPSSLPLMQLVKEFRVFYYRPAACRPALGPRHSGAAGHSPYLAGYRTLDRSTRMGLHTAPQLFCLFAMRSIPNTLNTNKKLVKAVEHHRDVIAEDSEPHKPLKPVKDEEDELKNAGGPVSHNTMVCCLREDQAQKREMAEVEAITKGDGARQPGSGNSKSINSKEEKKMMKQEAERVKQQLAEAEKAMAMLKWSKGDGDIPAVSAAIHTAAPIYTNSLALADDADGKKAKTTKKKVEEEEAEAALLREDALDQADVELRDEEGHHTPFWEARHWSRIESLVHMSARVARLPPRRASSRAVVSRHPSPLLSIPAPATAANTGVPTALASNTIGTTTGNTTTTTAAQKVAGRPREDPTALHRSVYSFLRFEPEEAKLKQKHHRHEPALPLEEIIFHGVPVASARETGSAMRRPRCGYSSSSLNKPPTTEDAGVIFVVLQLKPEKEQKSLLLLPHHKKVGGVMNTREFSGLTQWILSKALA